MQCRSCEAAAVAAMSMALAGCAIAAPETSLDTAGGQVAIVGGGSGECPEFSCGMNSPVIDVFGLHDASVVSESPRAGNRTMPNKQGLALEAVKGVAQLIKGTRRYALTVQGGRFIGTDCSASPCDVLQGAALVGASFAIFQSDRRYWINIASVRQTPYFLGPGSVEAYTLQWSTAGRPPQNLCNNIELLEARIAAEPGGGESAFATQELMGLRTFEAIVFEGDRIDKTRKTMSPTADDRWFNIGCAGHTLSKLRLTRNTLHNQLTSLPVSSANAWQRRQATLKLLVSDVCGGGQSLTVAGQRLLWQGDLMTYFGLPPRPELEARWTETGATCLHVPRLAHPSSALGATTFPDIRAAIAQACQRAGRPVPPDCKAAPDAYDFDGALRVSANP
jgi:hypothetical protein